MKAQQTGKLTFSKNAEASFGTGFQNWKDATRLFRSHECSKCLCEAVEKLVTLPATTNDVGALLNSQREADFKKNLHAAPFAARCSFSSSARFALSGLVGRVIPRTGEQLNQLAKLLPEFDKDLVEWLKRRADRYTSGDMLAEMVKTMSNQVLRKKASCIRGRFFTILVDETTDESTREQCVIVLRWVDEQLQAHEEFIGVTYMSWPVLMPILLLLSSKMYLHALALASANAEGSAMMVRLSCKECVMELRPRYYMSNQRQRPSTDYTHCYGHSLNLACQDMTWRVKPLTDSLDTVLELSKLLKYSAKRKPEFQHLKDDIAPAQEGFRSPCPTRWTVRASSLKSVLTNYNVLQEALICFEEMTHHDREMSA
ncbi:uncharacterized protein LOC135823598 [Sycon ciliatum]|uniref:uncharacterized protein LOC135823598 n=1 Tax=Sycon ciliatum TaxID=27933 RepID=UPI0031F706C4